MGDSIFDKYSALHFGSGVAANKVGIPFGWWLFLHLMFEYAENSQQGMNFINTNLTWWPGGKPRPDDLINVVGDNISAVIGWCVAAKIRL